MILAIRIIGSGYSDGAVEISSMKQLHAIELPIMLVTLFKNISATFDAHVSATIHTVGFKFMAQVAANGVSIIVGMMYDQLGFSLSYKILGVVVSFFVVVSYVVLTEDRRQTQESSQAHQED